MKKYLQKNLEGRSKYFPKMRIGSLRKRRDYKRVGYGANNTVPDAYDAAKSKVRKSIDDIKFERELKAIDNQYDLDDQEELSDE